jgi:hypothetical protein
MDGRWGDGRLTMDTMDEPVLFGAPPGKVSAMSMQISSFEEGRWGVTLMVHQKNRKPLMTLYVVCQPEQGVAQVLGAMAPMLHRADHLGVSLARRTLWALHNRLGTAGYEVSLRNCGTEPTK